jgi:hypothetical protein
LPRLNSKRPRNSTSAFLLTGPLMRFLYSSVVALMGVQCTIHLYLRISGKINNLNVMDQVAGFPTIQGMAEALFSMLLFFLGFALDFHCAVTNSVVFNHHSTTSFGAYCSTADVFIGNKQGKTFEHCVFRLSSFNLCNQKLQFQCLGFTIQDIKLLTVMHL